MLQRTLPAGFIAPCLPTKTTQLPSSSQWLHEIKHDGFRIIARKNDGRVRLYSRPGDDLTYRFPLIVETLAGLRSRSCIIDGEAVACDDKARWGAANAEAESRQGLTDSFFECGGQLGAARGAFLHFWISLCSPLGRRTVNTEPLLGSLVTVTSPPIMRASLREMARPSPVPP
jgi:hypothetical protein